MEYIEGLWELNPTRPLKFDPVSEGGETEVVACDLLSFYTFIMVLADLGARLHGALSQLSKASVVDDKVGPQIEPFFADGQVIDALLKELCSALLEADVNVKLVSSLRAKVKAKVGELGDIYLFAFANLGLADVLGEEESGGSREGRRQRSEQEECSPEGQLPLGHRVMLIFRRYLTSSLRL